MRKQLSIVLVEGDHVPRELSALLVGMGVWVKSTWSTGLDAALKQTTPHLVVCGDPSQLPLLTRTLALMHPGTPLLLIADWDLTRAQRAVASGLVEDLIPESLPVADIARRLATLASRRAMRVPSRSTLTPPTRAGIHPLFPVGVGRDDQTPESRQDHPVPSRRPPPLPVRVMSHAPTLAPTTTTSRAPAPPVRSVHPTTPPPAPVRANHHPSDRPPSLAPLTTSTYPASQHPPQHPALYQPHHQPHHQPLYPPLYQPQGTSQLGAQAQMPASWAYPATMSRSLPPGSLPPGSLPPGSLPPSSLGPGSLGPGSRPPASWPPSAQYALMPPDSAPPIQMITTTTMAGRRARPQRRSGPGFTLGAALGVAASAAAFVGVIEFEPDLRALTVSSAARATRFLGEHDVELPVWVTRGISGTPGVAQLAVTAPAPPLTPAPAVNTSSGTPAAPLQLADLGTVETDVGLGMSPAEAAALFRVQDTQLASCDDMLSGWQPPLPMIEEDRPKHAAAHRRRAQEHMVAGEPQKALRDLCKSARIDPAGPGTETLASVYLSLRSLQHAETWVKHFLSMNPRSDSGRELLGDVENQRGHVIEARAVWLEVLDVDRDALGLQREVSKHWTQDATSALAARDLAQAERKLRRALSLDPNNTSAALLLSRVLERQGEAAGSLAWAKRARELED